MSEAMLENHLSIDAGSAAGATLMIGGALTCEAGGVAGVSFQMRLLKK